MIDWILIIWVLLFVIFLVVNLQGSTTFGMIASFWLIILGGAIILTGVQIQTGMNITTTGSVQVIEYVYDDAVLPFSYPVSDYSFVWGIIFICIAMYMLLANAMKRTT